METKRIKIELTRAHRGGPGSTSFSGRPEGEKVRKELKIAVKDDDNNDYIITMPEDTTSFNPSFYLGLLFESIKKMGMEKFKKKYIISIENLYDEAKISVSDDINYALQRATEDLQDTFPFQGYI